jgi:hypothetical protein
MGCPHQASSLRPPGGQHVRQVEGRGRADIRFEDGLHYVQGARMLAHGLRGDTIRRDEEPIPPHIRIIGRQQHTDVPGDSRQHQRADAQRLEEEIQRGRIKARMLGLEHKRVLGVGLQQCGERLPADVLVEAMAQPLLKVGLPAATMVIDIYARHPRVLGTAFQCRNPFRHGEGLFEQGFAVRKGEIMNDINEEEGDRGSIRGIAMSIVLLVWHPFSSCRERRDVAELRGSVDQIPPDLVVKYHAQFLTLCSASSLEEVQRISSPWQGASPAKT